jgi:hypothetical protein
MIKPLRKKLSTSADAECEAWCYYSPTRIEVYVRPLDYSGEPTLPTPIRVLVPIRPPKETRS